MCLEIFHSTRVDGFQNLCSLIRNNGYEKARWVKRNQPAIRIALNILTNAHPILPRYLAPRDDQRMQSFYLALINELRNSHNPAEHSSNTTCVRCLWSQLLRSQLVGWLASTRPLLTLLKPLSSPVIKGYRNSHLLVTCPIGHRFVRARAPSS